MAKTGKTGILGLFAFLSIVINAVVWICDCFNLTGQIFSIAKSVASLLLVVVTLTVAYDFVKRQSTFWRVVYWILAIATICAILFGVGQNFVK